MKPNPKSKSPYPKSYLTDWEDDGSMTTDNNHRFQVSIDQDGFCITKEHGVPSSEELFGDLDYWPETVAWTGAAETLDDSLTQVAKTTGVSRKKLLATIVGELEEGHELEITAYLAAEKKALKRNSDLAQLRAEWSALHGTHRIPAVPSPGNPWGDCVDGLELDFDEAGWKIRHFSDSEAEDCPEIFMPEQWTSETLDGLFQATNAWGGRLSDDSHFEFTRDQLAELLIEHDPRWQTFIEARKTEPKS